jgi:hypothetical protein
MTVPAPVSTGVTSPGPQAPRESVLTPGLKTFLLAVAIVVLLAALGVIAGELVR